MIVEDFGCLLVNNARSRAYIQKLLARSYKPEKVILVDLVRKRSARGSETGEPVTCAEAVMRAFRNRKYFLYTSGPDSIMPVGNRVPRKYASFDSQKPVIDSLREAGLDYEIVRAESLNDATVVEAIEKASPAYFLFSGGDILRRNILSVGKKFIHLHPGYLPDVRGSMAVEWSILTQGKCAVSAFFMVEEIDRGELLARRFFDPPELEHNNIPMLYSPHIRSELLLDVVQSYVETGSFGKLPRESNTGGIYYHRMHPILNNVVFYECLKRESRRGEVSTIGDEA